MAKPRKSTFDAFVDSFCTFPIADQERALELMNFENRRAKIRAAKETKAAKVETKPAQPETPAAGEQLDLREPQTVTALLDQQPEAEASR